MIVLLDSVEKLEKYLKNVPPIAYDLISNSRSPLTIVYHGAVNLDKKLNSKRWHHCHQNSSWQI